MAEADRVRTAISRVARRLPAPAKDAVRPLARRLGMAGPGDWWETAPPLWARPSAAEVRAAVRCNVCRWHGDRFDGVDHVESATCPRCGSIARDRFLLWCLGAEGTRVRGARVLETSPRLGSAYRTFMRRWFDYQASDYDLSAHAGDIQLDLQDISLPDRSIDVVLTPHVLEHVPDTDRALHELHRILAPGGRVYLQVPVLQGVTGVPREPEFHADHTPVFFRFGWDLTERIRSAGFVVRVVVTSRFASWLTGAEPAPASNGDGFDLESMVAAARPADLAPSIGDDLAAALGFLPPYQFVTWECRRTT